MPTYACPRCKKIFDRKSNYDQHLRRKIPCPITNWADPCNKESMSGHGNIEIINIDDGKSELKSGLEGENRLEIKKLREEVEKLKNKPIQSVTQNNQNILQVLCIKSDDNYLDMLTSQWGDFHQALDFIKDCALSSLSGDCKLLKKIYFEARSSSEAPIKYLDKSQSKIEYYNDKLERIIDFKGQRLGRILANNLQNSYLKGVNYLITQNLENHKCPNKFLDDYDVQSWNSHIYELSDAKYQRKIVSQLEIPTL